MASIPDNSEKMISSTLPKQESMLSVLWTKIDQATYVVGDLSLFVIRIFSWMFSRRLCRGTLIKSAYQIGVLSVPVVGLTGMFIGMVLAVQSFFQFSQIGMESRMGAVINLTLVRELGPVLAATMLAGRVGSSMAAELGTMRVTEQIDALKSMGVNPIHFLVVPRVLAALLLIPVLTLMADFMGILGGFAYSHYLLQIDPHQYFEFSSQYVTGYDLLTGIIKSLFFGACIGIVSCYFGFHSQAGAQGVGNAATAAFVTSFVLILALDLMIGIGLDKIYFHFNPAGASLF